MNKVKDFLEQANPMKCLLVSTIVSCVFTLILIFTILNVKPDTKQVTVEIPTTVIHTVEYRTVIHYEQKSPKEYSCVEDTECRVLAEAIYYEARGEDLQGQIAVGWVIMNRVNSKYFPNSISEVVRQSCQFSYRCDGSMKNGFAERQAYKHARMVAKGIILGVFEDPTNGANHYLNLEKVKAVPRWARVYPKVASIGNHDFHVRH